jgi:2'-5' RNA ligase
MAVFRQLAPRVAEHLGHRLGLGKALTKAAGVHSGLLVALWLDPASAAALAQPDGEPASELHVTLCYCDADGLDEAGASAVFAALHEMVQVAPSLAGKTSGRGIFPPSEASEGREVRYAVPVVPGLRDFRERVATVLTALGVPPRTDHAYTPHITLAYVEPGAPLAPMGQEVALRFDSLHVRIGDRAVRMPFGAALTTAAETTTLAKEAKKKPGEDLAVKQALAELNLSAFTVLVDPTAEILESIGLNGARQGLLTVKALVPDAEDFALPANVVRDWAKDRAAELVGMRRLPDGTFIENPNPAYAITDGTRELLRDTITAAFEGEGMTPAELIATLEESYAFSEQRATLIARTEVGRALVQGNVESWKASGLNGTKESVLGSEHDQDDECDTAADDGPIPVEQAFSNGEQMPPYHPACVCDLIFDVAEETGAEAEA